MTDTHDPKVDVTLQKPTTEENVLIQNEATEQQVTDQTTHEEVSVLSCAEIIARVKELAEAAREAGLEF